MTSYPCRHGDVHPVRVVGIVEGLVLAPSWINLCASTTWDGCRSKFSPLSSSHMRRGSKVFLRPRLVSTQRLPSASNSALTRQTLFLNLWMSKGLAMA